MVPPCIMGATYHLMTLPCLMHGCQVPNCHHGCHVPHCCITGIPFAQVGRLCGSPSARTDGGKPRPYGGYGDSHSVHQSGWSASERVRRATCEVLCRGGVYALPPRPSGTHHLRKGDTRVVALSASVPGQTVLAILGSNRRNRLTWHEWHEWCNCGTPNLAPPITNTWCRW